MVQFPWETEIFFVTSYNVQADYSSGSQPLWDRGPENSFLLDEGPVPGRSPAFEKHWVIGPFKSPVLGIFL
jgi:hypothetical protein